MIREIDYLEMTRWRVLYFGSPGGRAGLYDLLRGLGLFVSLDEMTERLAHGPGAMARLLAGIEILAQLGVWHPENFTRLIDAMAGLPIPTGITGESVDGET